MSSDVPSGVSELHRSARHEKPKLAKLRRCDIEIIMRVEVDREEDGRWIAEVPDIPGAMVYGDSREEAIARVQALVLRTLADKIEHGEEAPGLNQVFTVAA